MLAKSPRLWLSFFLVLAGAYGILLYAETYAGAGCGCLATAPFPNPVRTERQLNEGRGKDAGFQREVAKTVLAARPGDPSAWMRLAYSEAMDHGGALGPEGLRALENSYVAAPYAAGLAPWRIDFILRHWKELTPEIRAPAVAEIRIVVQDPPRLYRTRRLARQLPRGDGKVAAYFFGLL